MDISPDAERSTVMTRQLTGVKVVLAAWVIVFSLSEIHPDLPAVPILSDVVRSGGIAIEAFFVLSGFVIAQAYLDGAPRPERARLALRFWWFRLAHLYPVYLLTLIASGVGVMVLQALKPGDRPDKSWLTPGDFVANLFGVQAWGPDPGGSWNWTSWTVSLLFLAYLSFPLLQPTAAWLRSHAPIWVLVLAWCLLLAPVVVQGVASTDPYNFRGWDPTVRVLAEFWSGVVLWAIVSRRRTRNGGALARWFGWILPALVIVACVALNRWDGSRGASVAATQGAHQAAPLHLLLLVPLLAAWIGCLAASERGISQILARRAVVRGGLMAFSWFMTFLIVDALLFDDFTRVLGGGQWSDPLELLIVVPASTAVGWTVWRYFEVPLRHRLRSLAGGPATPVESETA